MSIINATDASFDTDVVNSDGLVLVDFLGCVVWSM